MKGYSYRAAHPRSALPVPSYAPSAPPSDFLGSLSDAERITLASFAQRRNYAKSEHVFRAGDQGRHVYFLETGRIKIYQQAAAGRDVILWFCLPGEIFGLAEMARGGGRVVNALACEKCVVLSVPQDAFKDFVAIRPNAALLSMQVLAARLRGLSDVMVNLVADDVDTRVAKLILRLGARYGRRQGGVIHLEIPLTHQEIADMVGTTRQTVTSILSRLKRQGALSIDTHRIQIESEELLNGMVQQA